MCGIIGYINRSKTILEGNKIREFFTQGLYCDAVRGKHGTGVVAVDSSGDVEIYKKPMTSADFLDLKKTKEILGNTKNTFMIGHNRWATTGAHTIDNTHPFSQGNLHMVHNGTLDHFKGITPGKTFDVDSEAIAYLLSIKPAKEVLESLQGAFSLVWYDEDGMYLNFARNDDRPMYLAKVKNSDSIIFGSEQGMLEWLAFRINLDIEEVVSLGVGVILTVPLNTEEEIVTEKFVPKKKMEVVYTRGGYSYVSGAYEATTYKHEELKKRDGVLIELGEWTPYPVASTKVNMEYGSMHGYYEDLKVIISSVIKKDGEKYRNKTVFVKINTFVNDIMAHGTIKHVVNFDQKQLTIVKNDKVYGPGNKLIPIQYWNQLTKYGCSICSETLLVKDHIDIEWDLEKNPYCKKCLSTPAYKAISLAN